LRVEASSSTGARVLSSWIEPRPVPPSVNSGSRSSIEASSTVRLAGLAGLLKTTSIQLRSLILLMSTFAPVPGSMIVAVGPLLMNDSVVSVLPAPVIVLPFESFPFAFLNAFAAKWILTVPGCQSTPATA
jgi:hypothetical protein